MKNPTLLPTAFIAVGLSLSGVAIATAQGSDTAAETAAETTSKKVRGGDRGPKRHMRSHGRRGGHGGMGIIRGLFDRVDADRDGAVTQEEIDTFRVATVEGADASGDGAISLEEFQTIYLDFMRERMVDAFQKLDADGDGQVSQEEMDRRFGRIVGRMDRNDDGAISRADRGRRG